MQRHFFRKILPTFHTVEVSQAILFTTDIPKNPHGKFSTRRNEIYFYQNISGAPQKIKYFRKGETA